MIQCTDTPEALTDPWFVIWAESRAEKKVEQRMAAMGLSPWLPIVKERHRWSDRWRSFTIGSQGDSPIAAIRCSTFFSARLSAHITNHGSVRASGVSVH